jgi:asparagine synthase (glutamine-hydrolysing)
MCGIFGIFAPHGLRGDLAALRQGSDIAKYRGPDGDGTVWFDTRPSACLDRPNWAAERWAAKDAPTLLLCHRRLAIIDLSDQGRQPMATADGALWITYNGELYNFIELRDELKRLGARFDTESDT